MSPRYLLFATIACATFTGSCLVSAPSVAQATGGPVLTLSPSSATVAPGSQVTLTAGMPVSDAGTVSQEIIQRIDPTKLKLTSINDIQYPSGWTLSYSTDGTTFSSTAPSTLAGWAAVRAVKATGIVNSVGSDAGRQVAQANVSGTAADQTPATLTASTGDGYQAFFDPSRSRVFTIYHHESYLSASLDCWVVVTGARCAGFPFIWGGNSEEATVGRVVGTKMWIQSTGGLRCVNLAAVLANTNNAVGGGSPSMCSTPQVQLKAGTKFTFFVGASIFGESAETKLYALDSSSTAAMIYCVDTATMATCGTLDPQIPGSSVNATFDTSGLLKWGDRIYVMVSTRTTNPSGQKLSCVLITGGLCPGWTTLASRPTFAGTGSNEGKFFELPSSSGGVRAVCFGVPPTAEGTCWDANGVSIGSISSLGFPLFTRNQQGWYAYGSPVRRGTRLYLGNGGWSVAAANQEVLCYDAAVNSGAGGRCNGDATNLISSAAEEFENYTVTPDPFIDNCLWVTRHNSPVIRTVDIVNKTLGCSSIAPRRVTFAGSTTVPRMGCNTSTAIQQWSSFVLDTPSTGFTSAALTVQNSQGTAINGWSNVPLTIGTPIDLTSLTTSTTGQTPNFLVDFQGLSGTTTASARVRVVGDAPQLCLTPTAQVVCPTGSGPLTGLAATSMTGSASGAFTDSSNNVTTLSPVTTNVTITAPSTSQCGGTLSGTATLSGTSTPAAGITATLLDASGNPVLVNGQPVTATTAADGTYSFGPLFPGTYEVRFNDGNVQDASTATVVSGGSGTTNRTAANCSTGTSTQIISGLNWINTPAGGVRTSPTNLVTNGDFTDLGSFTAPPHLFWGERTVQSTARQELTVAVMGSPVVPYPGWVAAGVNGEAIPGWIASGGGVRTYATVGPLPNRGTTLGASTNIVYFGNGQSTQVTPAITWQSTGFSRQTLTVTNTNSEYGTSSPLTLSQSISTTVGETYRLQFHQLAEQDQSNDGLAAVEITGYDRTYFAVKQATRRIGFDFVATSATTTFSFLSWGHLPLATELAIDDVTVNQCVYVLRSNDVAVTAGGSSVVNATYTTPAVAAADTSTGAQGAAQTINVKTNDSASTGANLTSATINFCSTDAPPSGCTLTTKTVSGQGVYTISGGNVIFTPCSASNTPAGAGCTGPFTGTATPIGYQITDSLGSTATATITPRVVPPPTAAADTSTGAYNTAQTRNLLTNDSPASGALLSSSTLRVCNPTTSPAQTPNNCTVAAGSTINVPNVGSYVFDANGVMTFTPLASFTGAAPALRYQVQDTLGQYANSTYTPTVTPPPPPTAVADTSSGIQGATQTKSLVANDSTSASGQTLTTNTARLCASNETPPNCTATSLAVSGQGTYSLNTSTGVVTFTPCSASNTPAGAGCTGPFTGTATPVKYQVSTNTGQTATSTYTPTVVGAPIATPDSQTGPWDTNQTYSPVANDSAGAGTTLNAIPVGICATTTAVASCTGNTLTNSDGTYTLNRTTGVVTFDPAPGFINSGTPIRYVVADALGQTTASTITPTVTPPPAPAATPEEKIVVPGGSVSFTTVTGSGGLATTGGPAFNTSATCLFTPGTSTCDADGVVAIPGEGTYTLNTSTGVVTFAAAGNATTGSKTPITYQVTASTGQTATSTLTPIVPPPPTANNDVSFEEQNRPQTINLLGNDSASSPATLNASSVKLCPSNATAPYTVTNCNLTARTISNEGIYTVNADGSLGFVPCTAAGVNACPSGQIFNGQSSVRYVVADSLGQTASAIATATVLPPPATQAVADVGSANFGQTVTFNPLSNDSAGSLNNLSGYTSIGTASLVPSSVRLCGAGQVAPNCTATSVTTAQGVYSVNTTTGAITFTPATNFTGTPTSVPSYQVCNQMGSNWAPLTPSSTCATASVTPTIGPPSAPVIQNDTSTGAYNTPQAISVLNNDTTDPLLTFVPSSVRLCGAGQVAPNCTLTSLSVAGEGTYAVDTTTGVVTFTPLASFRGTVTNPPRYQVRDSFGSISSALITPTVTPPLAPVATPQQKSVLQGASVQFTNVIGSTALATGTNLQSGSLNGPCIIDPSDSQCKNTFAIAGEGTWTIDRLTGIVTFDADAAGLAGPQTPITYRVTDAVGQTATSTLTPILPPPAAPANDTSINALDINQSIRPLNNDIAGSGSSLVPATVKLCGVGEASPFCSQLSITVSGEGSYSVNSSGVVVFDPEPTFVGTATPIDYQVNDSLGRTYMATITPRVTSTPPTARPDTVSLLVGGTATFRSLFATNPLVTTANGGPTLDTTTACLVHPVNQVCATSVTIAGEGTYTLNTTTGVVTYVSLSSTTVGQKTPITYRITDADGFEVSSTLTPILSAATQPSSPSTTPANPSNNGVTPQKNSSSPRALDRKTWTSPLTPTYLNPISRSTPSRNQKFVNSKTRVYDERSGQWRSEVVTADGRWTVIRDNVRFIPREGFTGTTQITYRVTDTSGKSASAVLTVVVSDNVPELPDTGFSAQFWVHLSLLIMALGLLLTRVCRRLL